MNTKNRKIIWLLQDLYNDSEILNSIYRSVEDIGSGKNLLSPTLDRDNCTINDKSSYSVKFIPEYFKPEYFTHPKHNLKKFKSIKGYAIDLNGFDSSGDYMSHKFKSKSKANIIRKKKRLEKCYNISFHRYSGDLDKATFDALMNSLKNMIIQRFRERHEKNSALGNWDNINNNLLDLLRQHKASIFVISHEKEPICISVNYHYESVLFYFIPSYDISYAKFSLGNIMILWQLEWCFENNIKILDMGWGYLDYKGLWCNYDYLYENHILYPKNNIGAYYKTLIEEKRTKLSKLIRDKGLFPILQTIKNYISPPKKDKIQAVNVDYVNAGYETRHSLRELNSEEKKIYPLKLAYNDYLYYSQSNFREVKVLKCINSEQYYLEDKGALKKMNFTSGNLKEKILLPSGI